MNSTNKFLSEIDLVKSVPSIFATNVSEKVSSRYSFIPTINVVRGLKEAGFQPVKAFQSNTRIEGRENFVKHVMRFRHENSLQKEGLVPEIVLINSHDGTTSYQLRAGIFRLVCSNGLIVGDDIFCRKIKHQGNVIESVVESANDLIELVPQSIEKALEWKGKTLNAEQKIAYCESAMSLKWEKNENNAYPITPSQILSVHRAADMGNDLWTTFNIVQEKIIRGGLRYHREDGTRQRTRAVKSVSENVRLNMALWTLTEKMAQLTK